MTSMCIEHPYLGTATDLPSPGSLLHSLGSFGYGLETGETRTENITVSLCLSPVIIVLYVVVNMKIKTQGP